MTVRVQSLAACKQARAAGEAEWADFCDEQLTVSFWVPEGDFSHDHVQPVYLERCEIPEDAPE
ncbi:MAG: hypothetical protein IJ087_02050 [Eggerthellaceae bacterium]|nr:hypothetical protein [Eggerthellaceae bacterium]